MPLVYMLTLGAIMSAFCLPVFYDDIPIDESRVILLPLLALVAILHKTMMDQRCSDLFPLAWNACFAFCGMASGLFQYMSEVPVPFAILGLSLDCLYTGTVY